METFNFRELKKKLMKNTEHSYDAICRLSFQLYNSTTNRYLVQPDNRLIKSNTHIVQYLHIFAFICSIYIAFFFLLPPPPAEARQ